MWSLLAEIADIDRRLGGMDFLVFGGHARTKSNTPQQATGYLTLAAFAKLTSKLVTLAHCSRE